MKKTRKGLLDTIQSLQQLIPGDDYGVFIKHANLKYLDFIPDHQFLPSMNESLPKSLNDVELNVLAKSKKNYRENIFLPTVVEKQPKILIDKRKSETASEAVDRWLENIKQAKTPDELVKVINAINKLKKQGSQSKRKKSFWQQLFD